MTKTPCGNIRDFALQGPGNLEKLKKHVLLTQMAWVDFLGENIVVSYPTQLVCHDFLDRLLQVIEECGYSVAKTRISDSTGLFIPSRWQAFADFQAFRIMKKQFYS